MQWKLLRQWKSWHLLNRQFPRLKTDAPTLIWPQFVSISEDLFVRRSKFGWQGVWERESCSRRVQGEQWGAKGVLLPQLCTAPGAEMAPCDSTGLPALGVEHRAPSSGPVLLTEVISCDILGICQSGEWVPWFLVSTLSNRIRKLRFGFLQKLKKHTQTLNKRELFPAPCFSSLWFSPCKHWLWSLLFTKACWKFVIAMVYAALFLRYSSFSLFCYTAANDNSMI